MAKTLKEISAELGYSFGTVSRAINNKKGVSEKTRKKILEELNKLGYQPNRIAQSLAKQHSHLIGVILPDISNGFFSTITLYLEEALESAGYHMLLFNTGWDTEVEKNKILLAQANQVDGIILKPISTNPKFKQAITAPTVLISQEYDIVARYQGGNNAGHTVKNERGKFVLNLLPSGILRPNVVCVMGNGMVIDPHHLDGEINNLREQGISITPANLKISDRATITMPYHVDQDGLEEARLAKTGAQFGSTKRGIAYTYGDKYMKKTLRMGDLLHLDDSVKKRLVTMVDSKNLVMEGSYNAAPISVDEMWAWLEKYAAIFKDYICDVGQYLADADAAGKKVLFEAQLGALRDIDFGIYPYTTSSNVIGAYAPIGAGIPGHKLTNSIGVMKAYSSCVGDGPFTAELAMTEEEKHDLREAGHEYGAATGRPRRVGPIDLVASHYGVFCQGCDEVALTLLDVLDYMEKIPMVTGYKLTDGTITKRFPMGMALDTAQPVVEYLPGWHCDITAARKWEDLPQEARDYVEYLEKAIGCKITYISVGAEREAYIHHNV